MAQIFAVFTEGQIEEENDLRHWFVAAEFKATGSLKDRIQAARDAAWLAVLEARCT